MQKVPSILSIQHFCVHDGPGIRSVVFVKGCPLRCSWCQNPESWALEAELGHKRRQCIGCGTCVSTCPTGAMKSPGSWSFDHCIRCFECVKSCPSGALTRFGEARSAQDVLSELSKEFALYRQSGGGVTFSGGEASLFPDYLLSILRPLRDAGVHRAIETCGLFRLRHVLPLDKLLRDEEAWHKFAAQSVWQMLCGLDLVLFDLKLMDPFQHRQYCGADNARILRNFALLAALKRAGLGPALWPRLPLVPGITDEDENVRAVARFVRENGIGGLTLLPYHNLGVEKFDWLRRPETFRARQLPEERLERARRNVEAEGLRWFASGEEDYAADEPGARVRAASSAPPIHAHAKKAP